MIILRFLRCALILKQASQRYSMPCSCARVQENKSRAGSQRQRWSHNRLRSRPIKNWKWCQCLLHREGHGRTLPQEKSTDVLVVCHKYCSVAVERNLFRRRRLQKSGAVFKMVTVSCAVTVWAKRLKRNLTSLELIPSACLLTPVPAAKRSWREFITQYGRHNSLPQGLYAAYQIILTSSRQTDES